LTEAGVKLWAATRFVPVRKTPAIAVCSNNRDSGKFDVINGFLIDELMQQSKKHKL